MPSFMRNPYEDAQNPLIQKQNGYGGPQQQSSVANAAIQSTGKASNPSAAFGQAAQSWRGTLLNQYMQGPRADTPESPQPGVPVTPQPAPQTPPAQPQPTSPLGPGNVMDASPASNLTPKYGVGPMANPGAGSGGPVGPNSGYGLDVGQVAQTAVPTTGTNVPNTGTPGQETADQTAQRWFQMSQGQYGDAYKWLLGRPDLVERYWGEMARMKNEGVADFVHFSDWLHGAMPTMEQSGMANPGYMSTGTDTYANAIAKMSGQGGAPGPVGVPNNSGSVPGYGLPISQTGVPASNAAPTAQQPSAPSNPASPIAAPAAPSARPPAALTPEPSVPLTMGKDGTIGHGSPQAGQPSRGIAEEMRERFNPEFRAQQEELSRAILARQAYDKSLNGGGAAVVHGKEMNRLIGQQGAVLADYIFKGGESAANRDLERYGIDVQKEVAIKGQELQKYGIDINKLIEEYKIDSNDKLQRFLANLDAAVKREGIQGQVTAASMQAAATSAAAGAAADASKHNANLDFRLGQDKLRYEDIFNRRGFDLGVTGINRDIYQSDQNDRYRRDYLTWLMSPEGRMGGNTPFTLPGSIPF